MKPRTIIFIGIALLAGLFLANECSKSSGKGRYASFHPVQDSTITAAYPSLYKAVYRRDENSLQPFLQGDSSAVRQQAWRALASTPVSDIAPYLAEARKQNTKAAWFAVSMHSLTSAQLRALEDDWSGHPAWRPGINLVLGQQGDGRTLKFLASQLDEAAALTDEYSYALAVGRLMQKHPLEEAQKEKLLRHAFTLTDPGIIRAYLYGYYRGGVNKLNAHLKTVCYRLWKGYGMGDSAGVDQYIARILAGKVFYELSMYYSSQKLLNSNTQLAIELAQQLAGLPLDDRNQLAARMLIIHPNPNAATQALRSLQGKLKDHNELLGFIKREILDSDNEQPDVWLEALLRYAEAAPKEASAYTDKITGYAADNRYLQPVAWQIREHTEPADDYLSAVSDSVAGGNSLSAQNALGALRQYWNNLPEKEKTAKRRDKVRDIVFNALALHDRGAAFASQGLLSDKDLFTPRDFHRINQALSAFSLPGDVEVYQAFGSLYKKRFEQQAKPVIDSLQALNYAPLNRSLAQSGWDIAAPDTATAPAVKFRIPDWQRLWKMGRHPVWVLETDKGTIKVKMDMLTAPATVSAIDSLTRAGAYNGVPFHRVVPNFVIQGGDVERRDGLGGPDFIIPTEASELEFIRGAAGIASAGTDTEGSQYFFMNQWKPHLNGRYTLFGHVISGMDVVDRITVGDSVKRAYWE